MRNASYVRTRPPVDFIELHGAHGYLLHAFCSPLSNTRTDSYGGSLSNRISWPLRIVERVRAAWDPKKPLFYRISATDWAETPEKSDSGEWLQWGPEQNAVLVGELIKLGVDLVDVSTGGNWAGQKIPVGPNYQVGPCFGLTLYFHRARFNQCY